MSDVTDLALSPEFAFETWIYQESRTRFARLAVKGSLNIYVHEDGSLVATGFNTTGERLTSRSVDVVPLGTWSHVGVRYDVTDSGKGMLRVFLNGQEVTYRDQDILDCNTQLDVVDAPLVFGNRETGVRRGFDGLVAYAKLASGDQTVQWHSGLFPGAERR